GERVAASLAEQQVRCQPLTHGVGAARELVGYCAHAGVAKMPRQALPPGVGGGSQCRDVIHRQAGEQYCHVYMPAISVCKESVTAVGSTTAFFTRLSKRDMTTRI